MKVPKFIQRSIHHRFQVSKYHTNYEVLHVLNQVCLFFRERTCQVEETDIFKGRKEDDNGCVKEESILVVMG